MTYTAIDLIDDLLSEANEIFHERGDEGEGSDIVSSGRFNSILGSYETPEHAELWEAWRRAVAHGFIEWSDDPPNYWHIPYIVTESGKRIFGFCQKRKARNP